MKLEEPLFRPVVLYIDMSQTIQLRSSTAILMQKGAWFAHNVYFSLITAKNKYNINILTTATITAYN